MNLQLTLTPSGQVRPLAPASVWSQSRNSDIAKRNNANIDADPLLQSRTLDDVCRLFIEVIIKKYDILSLHGFGIVKRNDK